MDNINNNNRFIPGLDNWEWQPKTNKNRCGQLTLSDVTLLFCKEKDLLSHIVNRLGKTHCEVINFLKKLTPFK
jgi:hypothetical protein